ncbi:MAG: TIGR00266 family protein [Cyanobacteriota bacterium]|nr:TIGR00266 family protein [Cyanobacteriota bacterium]
MRVELLSNQSQTIAQAQLEPQEELIAQAGALLALQGDFKINTFMRRGRESGKGKMFQAPSKSLFLQSFKAGEEGGTLYLAPALVGNLAQYQMSKYKFIVRHSSYLACDGKIELFVGFESFKAKAGTENSTWLSLVGDGAVLVSGLGGIYPVEVAGDYTISLEHIVAFENTLKTKVLPKNQLANGAGVFCQFKGEGLLYCQTHRPKAMARRLEHGALPENFKLHRRDQSFKLRT